MAQGGQVPQPDIRELSFQNVIDTILKPAGIKVGGYPDDIFVDLSEEERDQWNCNICYLVTRDTRECDNNHIFCHTCIFAWSLTFGENSEKCPVCRNPQKEYKPSTNVNYKVREKRVNCPKDHCSFVAPLRAFLLHIHGRQLFENDKEDLESLRPQRPAGARLVVLPSGAILGAQGGDNDGSPLGRGRMMLQHMMLLLQMEMAMRQQALIGFSEAREPTVRVQRLDEVLALNEQLNEIGTILSNLLSVPVRPRVMLPTSRSPTNPDSQNTQPTTVANVPMQGIIIPAEPGNLPNTPSLSSSPEIVPPTAPYTTRSIGRPNFVRSDSELSSLSSDSDTSNETIVPRHRFSVVSRPVVRSLNSAATPNDSHNSTPLRPLRRHEIRAQIETDISSLHSSQAVAPVAPTPSSHRPLLASRQMSNPGTLRQSISSISPRSDISNQYTPSLTSRERRNEAVPSHPGQVRSLTTTRAAISTNPIIPITRSNHNTSPSSSISTPVISQAPISRPNPSPAQVTVTASTRQDFQSSVSSMPPVLRTSGSILPPISNSQTARTEANNSNNQHDIQETAEAARVTASQIAVTTEIQGAVGEDPGMFSMSGSQGSDAHQRVLIEMTQNRNESSNQASDISVIAPPSGRMTPNNLRRGNAAMVRSNSAARRTQLVVTPWPTVPNDEPARSESRENQIRNNSQGRSSGNDSPKKKIRSGSISSTNTSSIPQRLPKTVPRRGTVGRTDSNNRSSTKRRSQSKNVQPPERRLRRPSQGPP